MKIRPLRDLLVLRPLAMPGMIGSIHIPDFEKQANKTGGWCEVLAAGPDVELAHVGKRVHVTAYGSKFAGEEVLYEGRKCVLLRERDINGVEVV